MKKTTQKIHNSFDKPSPPGNEGQADKTEGFGVGYYDDFVKPYFGTIKGETDLYYVPHRIFWDEWPKEKH